MYTFNNLLRVFDRLSSTFRYDLILTFFEISFISQINEYKKLFPLSFSVIIVF